MTAIQSPFHNELQCYVRLINYDFNQKLGVAYLDSGSCTDMIGCISFFERIDPEVVSIMTIDGEKDDTLYTKRDGEWIALFRERP